MIILVVIKISAFLTSFIQSDILQPFAKTFFNQELVAIDQEIAIVEGSAPIVIDIVSACCTLGDLHANLSAFIPLLTDPTGNLTTSNQKCFFDAASTFTKLIFN